MSQPNSTEHHLPQAYLAQLDSASRQELFVALSTQAATAMLRVDGDNQVAQIAHDYADMALAAFKQQTPELDTELACQKGCHACCYLPVETSHQVIADIAQYIVNHFDAAQLQQLKAALAKDEQIRHSNKGKAPCALLSEAGTCRVYSHRPLSCRGFTSYDKHACDASLVNQAPVLQQPLRIKVYESLTVALQAVSQKRNQPSEQVPLAQGLLTQLNSLGHSASE